METHNKEIVNNNGHYEHKGCTKRYRGVMFSPELKDDIRHGVCEGCNKQLAVYEPGSEDPPR